MQPYVINALQLLGLGCISALIGALWTLLKFSDIKNFKAHAVFLSTILTLLGLAVLYQSRLFVGRALLDTITWFSAMWFVYLLMYLGGFRLAARYRHDHGFGASSMLSFQHFEETRDSATILDRNGMQEEVLRKPVESNAGDRGRLEHVKQPNQ